MKVRHAPKWTALTLVSATFAVFILYFAEVSVGRGVYYLGDTARVYLPEHIALSQSLSQGRLPWWTTKIGIGYPLVAEGQVGAWYPLNWLLHGLLPPDRVVTASILLHYLIGGLGCYLCARALGSSEGASYLGALVFALGGFEIAHLSHIAILSVAAWLPWMFWLTQGILRPRAQGERVATGKVLSLAVVVGLQFLAGHAQVSLLGLMAVGAYAVYLACVSQPLRRGVSQLGFWVGALLLGALLGVPQLWPGYELSVASQRAGGLDSAFFTSYSFHPFLLMTYLSPFILGNPYPQGSVELMGYVGLLPLALTSVAFWHSRARAKWFFATLALAGVVLAFGRWNPLYQYLRYVPVLNLFRAPARYLYWASFSLAILSAMGLDTLLAIGAPQTTRKGWLLLGLAGGIVGGALIGIALCPTVAQLIALWRWLPLMFLGAVLAVLGMAAQVRARAGILAACLVLLADLFAYGAVLNRTYNAPVSRAQVLQEPISRAFLVQDDSLYRVYTKEEIVPALSVMRESYYPNLGLTYGLSSANLYMPLVPRTYSAYLEALTAERLNRLNVKYYLIPQLLPVDAASELYDVRNPLASLPIDTWLELPPSEVRGLEIESYLSHAVDAPDGQTAAELWLRDESGREVMVPLRVGLDTAEWAYERDDVRQKIAHAMPRLATTFAACSGFPPHAHAGHTYLATASLEAPLRLVAVKLHPVLPEAFVRVERVRLQDSAGGERILAHLVGLGDHTIVYRSEDVVIYRNEDVLPRAYTLPARQVSVDRDGNVTLPETLSAAEVGQVQVVRYENLYVSLRTTLDQPGYLILADLAYPGWRATVDGAEAPILCADQVFRALSLSPGTHDITFGYRPMLALP